jgi:hypothetical protein
MWEVVFLAMKFLSFPFKKKKTGSEFRYTIKQKEKALGYKSLITHTVKLMIICIE